MRRLRLAQVAVMSVVALSVVLAPGRSWASGSGAVVLVEPKPTGRPGAQVNVIGLGFGEGQPVELRWNSVSGEQIGAGTGPDFRSEVAVPAADPGLYTVVALARDVNGVVADAVSTNFLVTSGDLAAAVVPTTVPGRPGNPPDTEPTPAYLWAVMAASLAALAVAVVRRPASGSAAPSDPAQG